MVVDQDHYVNRVVHEPGEHELTVGELGTPCVAVAAPILVDPANGDDVIAVNALQDRLGLQSSSAKPFEPAGYDPASLAATRCSSSPAASAASTTSSARGARSTRSAT
jgi:hypothetical protein